MFVPVRILQVFLRGERVGAMFEFTNHHALSVNGRFSSIRREDLLSLASRFGIGSAGRTVIADWGIAE